jgi:hypothetical protein
MSTLVDSNSTYGADVALSTDVINSNTGVQGVVTVGTSAVEAKVGGSKLTSRKYMTVYNKSSHTVYWGYTSGVTTTTGTAIFKDQVIGFSVGDTQTIYLISGFAGDDVVVTEGA